VNRHLVFLVDDVEDVYFDLQNFSVEALFFGLSKTVSLATSLHISRV